MISHSSIQVLIYKLNEMLGFTIGVRYEKERKMVIFFYYWPIVPLSINTTCSFVIGIVLCASDIDLLERSIDQKIINKWRKPMRRVSEWVRRECESERVEKEEIIRATQEGKPRTSYVVDFCYEW